MLTQEQIKKLKEGDKLTLTAFFEREQDGYVRFRLEPLPYLNSLTICASRDLFSLPSEHGTSVPTTKHDPCRLFKEGDRVTPKEVNGRHPGNRGAIYTVRQDEAESGRNILLTQDGRIGSITIDAAYLELVTPVEELEPYKLIDSPNTYNIVRDSAMVMTIHKKSHPNAKEAAEAECARLNAEYRKEQDND